MNVQQIQFGTLPADIFSTVAREAAIDISNDVLANSKKRKDSKDLNKSSQIRKFYDELVMFHDRIQTAENREQKYIELAPFIQMLNAKVAYAQGRELLGDKFGQIFTRCIGQVTDFQTLRHCKLFMEAMIGFRKSME